MSEVVRSGRSAAAAPKNKIARDQERNVFVLLGFFLQDILGCILFRSYGASYFIPQQNGNPKPKAKSQRQGQISNRAHVRHKKSEGAKRDGGISQG